MNRLRIGKLWIIFLVSVGVLGLGSVALARPAWLTETRPADSAKPPVAEPLTPGPEELTAGIEPTSVDGSAAARTLSRQVLGLSGFPETLRATTSTELVAGTDRMLIASFESVDGGLLDVVVQRLPKSTSLDFVDPGGLASEEVGPEGETIIVVDKSHTLQVVVVSSDGIMANIIVERINRVNPVGPSTLGSLTSAEMIAWAIQLISSSGDL